MVYPINYRIRRAILVSCLLVMCCFAGAQTYFVPRHGDTVIFANSGHVTTPLTSTMVGVVPMTHYWDNNDGWMTIYPDNGCQVYLQGSYNTEDSIADDFRRLHGDVITFYDGADTNAPVLTYAHGDGFLAVMSTSGVLTVRFQSDGYIHFNGFDFEISSVANCNCSNDYDLGFEMLGNALKVSWLPIADGQPHLYSLEYGLNGFVQGNGRMVQTDTCEYLIENLYPGHNYDFYLYYDCGPASVPVTSSFQMPNTTSCIQISSLTDTNIICTAGNCQRSPIVCTESYAYDSIQVVDFGQDSRLSRHTIVTTNERDPRTGSLLNRIQPGNSQSVRLGNWITGSTTIPATGPQAESISYEYFVDTTNAPILLLQYAAVMEDPGHPSTEQPRFMLELLNQDGTSVDSICGSADFVSDSTLGWDKYDYWTLDESFYHPMTPNPSYIPPQNYYAHTVYWKDWTSVGVDLTSYHNQRVKIRLTTYDCKENAHFGYAYFNLDCNRKEIFSDVCGDDPNLTYTAPAGFEYRWYFEDSESVTLGNAQSIALDGNGLDRTRMLCCQCSFLGDSSCGFVLKCALLPRWPISNFTAERDSCSSTYHFSNHSGISNDGIHVNPANGISEASRWDFGDGTNSDQYQPAPHTYAQPGYYDVTLISMLNDGLCADTMTQRIFVPNYTSSVDTTVCQSYRFYGQTLTHDTIIEQHYRAFDGCDSVVTRHITVLPNNNFFLSAAVVENQLPYTWPIFYEHFYDEDTIIHPFRNGQGCIDTATLILHVYRNTETYLDTTICDDLLPFVWQGKSFSQTGEDTLHLYTTHGADSIVHLFVQVWHRDSIEIFDTIVENQLPYTAMGMTFYGSRNQDFHYLTIHGCDSLVRYHLWVWPNDTIYEDTLLCESDLPYWWRGHLILNAATFRDAYLDMHGADSIWIRSVQIIPRNHFVYNQSITENELPYTWQPYGNVFHNEGRVDTILTNAQGCADSLSLILNVHLNTETYLDTAICENSLPFSWLGRIFNASGDDTLHLFTQFGADSIVHLHLSVWMNETTDIWDTIVENQLPHTAQGTTFNADVSQNFHYLTIHGCDSLVRYHLWVWPNDTMYEDTLICESDLPYQWRGHWYGQAGTRTDAYLDCHGADSVWIRAIQIIPQNHLVYTQSVTENDLPFIWQPYGNVFTNEGRVDTVLTNAQGCEDSLSLILTVHLNTETYLDTIVCENSLPLNWLGKIFNIPGSDTLHLYTQFGADSIVHLNVSIWHNDSASVFDTIVENQLPYVAQGQTFSGSVDTIIHYFTSHGCDSLVHYHLYVHPNVRTVCDSSLCASSAPLHWNGIAFSTTRQDSVTLTAHTGADSVVVMRVTVNALPTVSIQVQRYGCDTLSATLTAVASDSSCSYLWSSGATADSILIHTAGVYSVTVTDQNGCVNHISESVHAYHSPIVSTSIPELCAGEQEEIRVGYSADSDVQLAGERSSIGVSDSIFIPDGYNCPPYGNYYRSNIQFSDFSPSAVIRDANDIQFVRLKMEHSAIEDIRITLGCPNGSTCKIVPDYQNDGWEPGIPHYFRLNLGVANRLQDNASCDASLNAMGIPWNYVWSNNTTLGYQYAGGTYGYCYEPANIQTTYNPYWDDGIASYKIDSSNVANMSQIYHPNQSFGTLTGCPLNGNWYIQIQDFWINDNGYLVEWELSLSPELLPAPQPPVTSSTLTGPWVTRLSDTTFRISPPTTLTADTTVTYIITVFDSAGCSYDTSITTRFYCNPVVEIYDTIVQNQLPYTYGGYTFPTAGAQSRAHTFQLQTTHGCDSTVNYHLFVWPNDTTTLTRTICADELPYIWESQHFNAAGTQQRLLLNCHGADSLLILHLIVNPVVTDSIREEIVENQLPYVYSGYNFADDVADTVLLYTTHLGCDSVVHYSLLVHRNTSSTYDTAVCRNAMPFVWHGVHIPSEGVFLDTLLDRYGADSVLILQVTENPPYVENYDELICEGDGYHGHGFDLSASQTIGLQRLELSHTYQSIYGCDSVINLELSIVDTGLRIISLTNDFCEDFYADLSAVGNFTDYIWNTDETSADIHVTSPGTYAVTASDEHCSATAFFTVDVCDFQLFLPNTITPSNHDGLNDFLCISDYAARQISRFEIRIFNRWGEEVFLSTDKNFKWYGEYKGKTFGNTIYNYAIRCSNLEGRQFLFTGSVTVL